MQLIQDVYIGGGERLKRYMTALDIGVKGHITAVDIGVMGQITAVDIGVM